MAVTPKGIVTPDPSSPYNLITDLNTLASTADAAISNASNMLKGTASQRAAALAGSADGVLWQDTDGIKMIWRKDGAAWVPAITRWTGTTAQMSSFTQAPEGFEWWNSTDNSNYVRLSGSWSKSPPDTGWQNLTNIRGGLTAASPAPRVRVRDGLFLIEGAFDGPAYSGGYTAVATIPASCVPPRNINIAAPSNINVAVNVSFQARPDGNLYAFRSGTSGSWLTPAGAYPFD